VLEEADLDTGSMNAFTAQAQVLHTRMKNVETCSSAAVWQSVSYNRLQELCSAGFGGSSSSSVVVAELSAMALVKLESSTVPS
jgi:hypothetical protein